MRTSALMFISSVMLWTASATAAPTPKAPIQRSDAVPRPVLPKPVIAPRQCPDLAASVEFRVIERYKDGFTGRVEITAKVQNRGAEYVSGATQQSLNLYEKVPGARDRLIATVPFQNLAPNASQSVSFTRDWNRSSPAEGEFPPAYKAIISFDPDIRLDSNPKNDDCQSNNDQAERSGSEINTLLTP